MNNNYVYRLIFVPDFIYFKIIPFPYFDLPSNYLVNAYILVCKLIAKFKSLEKNVRS